MQEIQAMSRPKYRFILMMSSAILLLPAASYSQGIGIGYYNAIDGGQGMTLGTGIGLRYGNFLIVEANCHYIDLGQFTLDAEIATEPWVQTKVVRLELPAVLRLPIGVYELFLVGGAVGFFPTAFTLLPGNIDRDLRADMGVDILNAELEADPSMVWGAMLGTRITLPASKLRLKLQVKAYFAQTDLPLTGTYAWARSDGTYGTGNYDEELPLRFNGLEVGISIGK
jgi:hypothetical protein